MVPVESEHAAIRRFTAIFLGSRRAAEKLIRLKGAGFSPYIQEANARGFQPVRNYFEMNVALATEGTNPSKQGLFPQPI